MNRMDWEWKCPICKEEFPDSTSKGGHMKSSRCYANAEGEKLGRTARVVQEDKRPDTKCLLCSEEIDGPAVLIPKWYARSKANVYICLDHFKNSFLTEMVLKGA